MAGTQPPHNINETLKPVKDLWQIHYSRFFTFPNLPSTCPTLKPVSTRCIKRNPHGKWLSSSSMASVHLITDHKFASGFVLIVSFQGKVYLFEGFLSLGVSHERIEQSMRSVSCMEECPVRGSRVIFASYRDNLCQEGLKEARNIGPTNGTCGSKMTSPSRHTSTSAIHKRPVEEISNVNPVGNYETVVQPISNDESIEYTCPC